MCEAVGFVAFVNVGLTGKPGKSFFVDIDSEGLVGGYHDIDSEVELQSVY